MKFPSFLFIFFLTSSIFLGAGDLWAKNGWPKCPENGRNVEIYMETSMGDLRYHEGLNNHQLARMRGNVGRRLGPMWTPTGLTVADENYHLKTGTKIYQLGRGRYCAILQSANLFIGFKKIDVYISNKYRQGSCEHNSILNHENVHVQIFRDTLYKHTSGIERAIRRKAPRIGPVYLRSADAAANKLQKLLDAQIRPLFKRMSADISRKNARIDTKANYRREQAMCQDW
ncbi:exported hypothetical protein [Candidatus Terasakiella magnetica]|uniref:DUF922 domain-containing protein n=1 Tax=Candidatus Terasakiella magnetica TaxID=1867952 RepID=A0A1C3RCC5_9PROT|nr:hypothetical protein [Candidatus Terasakiella magnetica]SCA54936.1 exported hypothetical protein [Candidatus Terasakiella magnetica]